MANKPNSTTVARRAWIGLVLLVAATLSAAQVFAAPSKLPPITYPFADQGEFWVNSKPINDRDIERQPVLIFFWTFGCYNCRNSLEWINAMQDRFADKGLLILGVHTPEFPHERDKGRVAVKTKEFGIEFPVMIDNDYVFWKNMQNSWWPAFHLYDRYGELRGTYVGETHLDTEKAEKIESLIDSLLES